MFQGITNMVVQQYPPVAPSYLSELQKVCFLSSHLHLPSHLRPGRLNSSKHNSYKVYLEFQWAPLGYIQSGFCTAPYGYRAAAIKKHNLLLLIMLQRDKTQTWKCVCIPVLVVDSGHTVTVKPDSPTAVSAVCMWLNDQRSFWYRSIHRHWCLCWWSTQHWYCYFHGFLKVSSQHGFTSPDSLLYPFMYLVF